MKDLLIRAYILSKQYHAGQVDKSGKDYFSGHIKSVYKISKKLSSKPEVGIVALLHDIVEDTPITIDYIHDNFGTTIATAVDLLTKRNSTPGIDYGYLSRIKSNPIARIVKIADLTHNSDIKRLKIVTPTDLKRFEKYKLSLEYLKS